MPLSNAVMNALLDAVLRGTDYVGPNGLWLSLHTADPGLTGANELPNAEAYARVLVRAADGSTGAMAAAAAKASTNSSDFVFPEAGGDGWPAVTHVGLWDAAAHGAGNFVGGAALAASKTAAAGVAIRIKAGDFDVTGT